eukprot:gene10181-13384_t
MADIRLHRPMGIATGLTLALPLGELQKAADRLDWSVPKKHLARRIYPPAGAACSVLPSTAALVVDDPRSAQGQPTRWARGRQPPPRVHSRAEEVRLQRINDELRRHREFADGLESVNGLHPPALSSIACCAVSDTRRSRDAARGVIPTGRSGGAYPGSLPPSHIRTSPR